jgi:hypothetical protein
MICKQHYLSAASMPFVLLKEMQKLKHFVEIILKNRTGYRCICFEHGVTGSSFGGANSMDHVHLHIIPFPRLAWPDIAKKHNLCGFDTIDSYDQLCSLWAVEKPKNYLFFQDIDETIYYRPDSVGFPSQFFRICVSPLLNAKRWNWKEEYYEENIKKTIVLFS